MQKFFGALAKNEKGVAYGEVQVKKALDNGVVDVLLLSEDLDDAKIEKFETIAEQFGTKVELISTETR